MPEAKTAEKEPDEGSRVIEPLDPLEIEIDPSGKSTAPKPKDDKKAKKDGPEVTVVPAEALAAREALDKPNDPIAELRRQLDTERDSRSRAEQAARDAAARADQAERSAGVSTVNAIDMAIDAQTRAAAAAKERMTAMLDAGNHKEFADAQEAFNTAQYDLLRLREQKVTADQQVRQPPRQQLQQQASQLDQVVANLERAGTPKSAQWLRAHPEQAQDLNRLDAAHRTAVFLDKLSPDSDAYFDRMEGLLGIKQPEARLEPRSEPAQRATQRAAAPVTREALSLGTGQPQRIRISLTSEQRETARFMGMSDEEYALEMHRAKESGQLNGGRGT